MSGFVLGRDGGDTYAWRGAEVRIKASADDTTGQLGVMEFASTKIVGSRAEVENARGRTHAFC